MIKEQINYGANYKKSYNRQNKIENIITIMHAQAFFKNIEINNN